MPHEIDHHPSRRLVTASGAVSRRASSWDRTGRNRDCVQVPPGTTVTLLEVDRPGCVNHIYMVIGFNELTDYRDAIIRCYWDGEQTPSVEVPMGDFFGLTHPLPPDALRFHVQWRQERPTRAEGDRPNVQLHEGVNLDGAENYVALEAVGRGQMVGLVLEVDNPHGGWFGEGDDMVFIDGDTWPPSIHGTGTEEVFGGAASPTVEFAGLYAGWHLIEHADYSGATGMYRWFAEDPIRFTESIRWTIEHGHANNFAVDYSSVAYWYQDEPHAPFPPLPCRDDLLPVFPPPYEDARAALARVAARAVITVRADPAYFDRVAAMARRYYRGDFAGFLEELERSGLG